MFKTLRFGWCVPILALAVAAARAGEDLRRDLLFYMSFDGTTDLFMSAKGLMLPAAFSRNSRALTPDFEVCERHQPRFAGGKIGQGIFLESGDYGNYMRGTMNHLPPGSALSDGFPRGFATGGAARAAKAGAGRVGQRALRVACAGDGYVETRMADLPHAMRYIGSVYARGETGGEKIWVSLHDLTNGVVCETEAELGTGWRRIHVALPYNEGKGSYGGKELKKPIGAVLRVSAEAASVFHLDGFMIEQAGIHYSDRTVPSTWIEGGGKRATESLLVRATPDTLNPEAGTFAFWAKCEPGGLRRTLLAVGLGWDTPIHLAVEGASLNYSYCGKGGRANAVLTNDWMFLAVTWKGKQSVLFVDGRPAVEVTAGKGLADIDVFNRSTFIMPGNADAGGTRTHAEGVIDEFHAFGRSLEPDEIARLAAMQGPLLEPSPVMAKADLPVKTFARDLGTAPLRFAFVNRAARTIAPVTAAVSLDGVDLPAWTYAFPLAAGETGEITVPLPVEKLAPGGYRLRIDTSFPGGGMKSQMDVRVAEARNPERLPVLAWLPGGTPERLRLLSELGVTVTRDTSPGAVDWATEAGLHTHPLIVLRGSARRGVAEDAILGHDGVPHGANPLSGHVLAEVRREAAEYAENIRRLDTVRYAILNSEWLLPLDFGEKSRRLARRKFGLDLAKWIAADPGEVWKSVHPFNRLNPTLLGADWFPADGVVRSSRDPFYRFHLWWHTQGPNEQVINRILAEEIKRVRPDITTIVEPVLRRPPVRVYPENIDVAQEWFYYENPLAAVQVQERLAAVSRGSQMKPSGMPQFLFKPGGAAPFAATPPPDMLRQVVWLCASRPLAMMSFWGWHRVLDKGKCFTIGEIKDRLGGLEGDAAWKAAKEWGEGGGLFIPEVRETFADLSERLWKPFGPLLMKWRNLPRHVAVLDSLANHIYNNNRWPQHGWLMDALTSSGVPYDVLFDQDFLTEEPLLDRYSVLVLPRTHAMTDCAHNHVTAFLRRGGRVVADAECKVGRLPGLELLGEEGKGEFIDMLRDLPPLPVRVKTDHIIWNVLGHAGAKYLVVVNDLREPGEYLGRWGRVREKGIAQTVELAVNDSFPAHALDMNARTELAMREDGGWRHLTLALGPAEGKIVLFAADVPKRVDVSLPRRDVRRGETVDVDIAVSGNGPVPGAIPCDVTITRPSGARCDSSGVHLLEGGRRTFSFVVPLNAENGVWKVAVTEGATGTAGQATVTVR
ncbi:MAG: hypothetical protein GX548_05460 [Lentisphaerae bacterium]|nr:hypothetical protein [Lentisphaerota bacterium]